MLVYRGSHSSKLLVRIFQLGSLVLLVSEVKFTKPGQDTLLRSVLLYLNKTFTALLSCCRTDSALGLNIWKLFVNDFYEDYALRMKAMN